MGRPYVASAVNIQRERGFADGNEGKPKRDRWPDEAQRDSYLRGYRLGREARARAAKASS